MSDDYREAYDDSKRFAREIDAALHGEENAAPQASLCDLVEPARALRLQRDALREALEDIVYQFGYDCPTRGKPGITTGGLSALEDAFEALGWDDPHETDDPVWCDAPVTPRCPHVTTSGTPTPDGYKRFCRQHFSYWQEAQRAKSC